MVTIPTGRSGRSATTASWTRSRRMAAIASSDGLAGGSTVVGRRSAVVASRGRPMWSIAATMPTTRPDASSTGMRLTPLDANRRPRSRGDALRGIQVTSRHDRISCPSVIPRMVKTRSANPSCASLNPSLPAPSARSEAIRARAPSSCSREPLPTSLVAIEPIPTTNGTTPVQQSVVRSSTRPQGEG